MSSRISNVSGLESSPYTVEFHIQAEPCEASACIPCLTYMIHEGQISIYLGETTCLYPPLSESIGYLQSRAKPRACRKQSINHVHSHFPITVDSCLPASSEKATPVPRYAYRVESRLQLSPHCSSLALNQCRLCGVLLPTSTRKSLGRHVGHI